MDVLIVGTGNMGQAIGTRLVAGGQPVTLYNPNREKAEQAARDLQAKATGDARADVTLP